MIDEVGVFDLGKASVVAITKDTTKLGSRRGRAARHDQRCAAKIDEGDLAAFLDPPTPTQLGGHARLTPMRHSRVARCSHICIVTCQRYKAPGARRPAFRDRMWAGEERTTGLARADCGTTGAMAPRVTVCPVSRVR